MNAAIAGIVGKKYWDSRPNGMNNEKFAALARDIYAQLNDTLGRAAQDLSKTAVEVFVNLTVDHSNGLLESINSFQINLYRVIATLGGVPTTHAQLKAFAVSYVGSRKDQLNTPPWKDFLSQVTPKLKMMARIRCYFPEQKRGLPSEVTSLVGSKTLPVFIVGEELFDASTFVKNKRAYPCVTVDAHKKMFSDPDQLKDFILSRIEPNLTFVRSRSGQRLVDKEIKKVAQVLNGVVEDRRIAEPSSLKSIRAVISKAEAALKKTPPRAVGNRLKKIEKAAKALLDIKDQLKELRVGLKTVKEELANLEKKFGSNLIPYPTYSSENTRFLARKNALENELSSLLEDLNNKVMKPLKVKM
jgi:hypothetical protein